MLIIDKALREREAAGRPIRVGMVGAGFMGRGVALQIATAVPGMRLVAIANRHLEPARRALPRRDSARRVRSKRRRTAFGDRGRPAVAITDDWRLICEADGIDAIIEATGALDYGGAVVCSAIEHGKHVVLMNAELDGTVGPI